MFLASGPGIESARPLPRWCMEPNCLALAGEGLVWGTWNLAPLWGRVWDILGPEDLPWGRRKSPSDRLSSKADLSSLSWTLDPSALGWQGLPFCSLNLSRRQ